MISNQGLRVNEIGYGLPLSIKVILITVLNYSDIHNIVDSFVFVSNIKVNHAGGQGS